MEKNFVPMIVGTDLSNLSFTLKAWENLLEWLNWIHIEVTSFLEREDVNYDLLTLILSPNRTESEIAEILLNIKNPEAFNDFDVKALYDAGAIKGLKGHVLSLFEVRKNYFDAVARVKSCHFNYPVEKLFNIESGFSLTEDFNSKLREYFTSETQNENQNEALKALKKICEGLNTLRELKILRVVGGFAGIDIVKNALKIDKSDPKLPYIPHELALKKLGFRNK